MLFLSNISMPSDLTCPSGAEHAQHESLQLPSVSLPSKCAGLSRAMHRCLQFRVCHAVHASLSCDNMHNDGQLSGGPVLLDATLVQTQTP